MGGSPVARDERTASYLAEKNPCAERALAIDERVYGPEHPSVAMRADNLGNGLRDLGDLAGARTNYERVSYA